jgi:hypothetical protein
MKREASFSNAEAASAGACRLETRSMPNGPDTYHVHAPRVGNASSTSTVSMSTSGRSDIGGNGGDGDHGGERVGSGMDISTNRTTGVMATSEGTPSHGSSINGGSTGAAAETAPVSSSSTGDAKELLWSELQVGDVVSQGSFGQVNHARRAYVEL